jgi:hypothetical protein
MNNLELLEEDKDKLRRNVAKKALSMNGAKLRKAVHDFAGVRAKMFFVSVLDNQ